MPKRTTKPKPPAPETVYATAVRTHTDGKPYGMNVRFPLGSLPGYTSHIRSYLEEEAHCLVGTGSQGGRASLLFIIGESPNAPIDVIDRLFAAQGTIRSTKWATLRYQKGALIIYLPKRVSEFFTFNRLMLRGLAWMVDGLLLISLGE